MQRRHLLLTPAALVTLDAAAAASAGPAAPRAFSRADGLEEVDATALMQAMAAGRLSSEQLVRRCLARIAAIDKRGPKLNSVIELNPDAISIAQQLDVERRAGEIRGPLHGLPVLLKDNVATGDRMCTTAGSLALEGVHAARDAHLVKRLRAAGAVVLGKTNLSEWANIRSTRSTSGWSGRGGLTRNPYALDRCTSGSSAGSAAAVAASLVPFAVGTETDGSIVSPASLNGIVGLKPTLGSVSRDGVIPIAHSQDTAGPMTRSVADAALLFAAMAGPDAADPITTTAPEALGQANAAVSSWVAASPSATSLGAASPSAASPAVSSVGVSSRGMSSADGSFAGATSAKRFSAGLSADSLRGARLGIAPAHLNPFGEVNALFDQAVAALRAQGAEVIDDIELPTTAAYRPAERLVLLYELKHDLAQWLQTFAPEAKMRTLADVIAFNTANADREMPWFAQELFEQAEALGGLDSPEYLAARATCLKGARDDGLDRAFDRFGLDAVIAPTGGVAWLIDPIAGDHSSGGFAGPAAIAGYPHLTVPAGFVRGLPTGLSFVGRPFSEWRLLNLGYAFEQATKHRQAPRYLPRSVPV